LKMVIETYFGESFARRLQDLLSKYEKKLDCEFSLYWETFFCYLIADKLAKSEIAYIEKECTEMCQLSINPCRLNLKPGVFEFIAVVNASKTLMLNGRFCKIHI